MRGPGGLLVAVAVELPRPETERRRAAATAPAATAISGRRSEQTLHPPSPGFCSLCGLRSSRVCSFRRRFLRFVICRFAIERDRMRAGRLATATAALIVAAGTRTPAALFTLTALATAQESRDPAVALRVFHDEELHPLA